MLSLYVTYVTANAVQSSPYRLCEGSPPPYFFRVTGCDSTQSECPFYMGVPIDAIFTFTIRKFIKILKIY